MSEAGDWQMKTVLQVLWSFVVKRTEREIDFIFWSIYATLIYGHYLWIVTIRMKLKKQKASSKWWLWPPSKTGWGSQAFGRVWLKPLLFKIKKSLGNLTWCLLDVCSVRSFAYIRNFQADLKHTGEIMSLNQRDGWVERSLEICYVHEPNSCILLKRNGWSFLLSLLQHQTTHRYS